MGAGMGRTLGRGEGAWEPSPSVLSVLLGQAKAGGWPHPRTEAVSGPGVKAGWEGGAWLRGHEGFASCYRGPLATSALSD